MFGNIKLGSKVVLAFIFLIAVMGFVCFQGYSGMKNIMSGTNQIVDVRLPGIQSVLQIAAAQCKVLVGERGLINNKMMSPDIRKAQYDYIDANFKEAEEIWNVYKTLAKTNKEGEIWNSFIPKWNDWKKGEEGMMAMMREKDRLLASGIKAEDSAVVELDNKAMAASFENRKMYLETSKMLDAIAQENIEEGKRLSKNVGDEFVNSTNKMYFALGFGVFMAFIVGWLFVGNVKNIIGGLIDESKKLTDAAVNGKLDVRADLSLVNFEFRDVMDGLNRTLDAVIRPLNIAAEYVDRISKGDIPPKITDNYNGDFNEIKNNLNQCIDAVNSLVADAVMLAKAAVDGRLATRADASKHQGDFRKIVQGVNDTLNSVIGPLNVAAEYVDRISKGDIPPKITDNYNGDFNEIKNNLNQCIDGLGGLIESNKVLQKMAVNDYTLSVTGTYNGVFADVAKAVNQVQERIKHLTSTIVNISNGELAELTAYKQLGNGTGRRSENDQIAPAMIRMMSSLNELVTDSEMLSQAAVDGKLSTRADVSKHHGDFRKVVEGVNKTLDAVVDPVNEARGCLEEMAKGNLDVLVKGNYKGDHAILKNALNSTLDSINDILTQVNTAVEQVNSGAMQVSDASQSLSQSATEAASSLEEVSASMQEVNSQTKQNADNATQANQLSTQARISAETGNAQMKQMLKAMNDINESANNISKIIKAIDEIAFQTNLLALNAAVEAARAGKHGKGFTVVAEEVRNLAQRSAKAAKETTEMIESSIKKTDAGTKIADVTSKALEEIVTGSAKVTDLIGEIASASKEQAQAVLQINQGLSQVDQVTQQNTATAEESAAASEELSSQAVQLKDMLGKFRLRKQDKVVSAYVTADTGTAKREIKQIASSSHKMVNVRNQGAKGKKPASQASQKPEELISLDDNDYGKF